MTAMTRWLLRIQAPMRSLFEQFWTRLKEKGLRFFCVAVLANSAGIACGYGLFKSLAPIWPIALISVLGGILHVLITYSAHYHFTFKKSGDYLRGLWKVYLTAWLGMLLSSVINQFLMGTLQMSFFLAQAVLFCFGAAYSLTVNFLFIFRRQSS